MSDRNLLKPPFRLTKFLYRRWPLMARFYSLSKFGFPFMLPSLNPSPMRQLRAHARRTCHANQPLVKRWSVRVVMTLSWPSGALVDTIYNLRIMQGLDRPQGVARMLLRGAHMFALALSENVPPFEYVAYRLHDRARRDRISEYFYWNESYIFNYLNDRNGADNADVQDKGRFAEICQKFDLPCITTLAIYQGGRQVAPEQEFLPDQPCLWVKDLAGSQGRGAGQWWLKDGSYRDADGNIRTPSELVASWRSRNCLVQPCLFNHPDLECLSDGTLADIRIITGIAPDGAVQIISHQITLPWGGFASRPYSVLGILDGNGWIAHTYTYSGELIDRHSGTDVLMANVVVPFWREAQELVMCAHRQAFSRFVFLGWDVAITADGPVLIETNSGPGVYHHQLVDDVPFGHTAFAAIAAQYFNQ